MSTTPTQTTSRGGGEGLLALMGFAVLLGSGAIALLGILGSWWLLPVAILAVIVPAIAVAALLGHLMSDADAAAPEREPATAPLARLAAGH
jgi:fatty acid desaturase